MGLILCLVIRIKAVGINRLWDGGFIKAFINWRSLRNKAVVKPKEVKIGDLDPIHNIDKNQLNLNPMLLMEVDCA